MQEAAGLLGWLAATPLSQAMRDSLWLYPLVETVHIVGFVGLVGAVMVFDLRVLGWRRSLPVQLLAPHVLPVSMASAGLVLPAGALLFVTNPLDFAGNPVFLLKLALIGVAALNALLFHLGPYRQAANWPAAAPLRARAHALLSLGLWVAVISCGRLLAYT